MESMIEELIRQIQQQDGAEHDFNVQHRLINTKEEFDNLFFSNVPIPDEDDIYLDNPKIELDDDDDYYYD